MLELTGPKELVLICVNGKFKAVPCDYSHDPCVEYSKELLNVNNMADLATKLSNIPLTLLRDFLSPKEEDTLFLNDLEEELAFPSVTSIFSRRKFAKTADFFELKVSRYYLDDIRSHFWMTSTTFELLANFLAPS